MAGIVNVAKTFYVVHTTYTCCAYNHGLLYLQNVNIVGHDTTYTYCAYNIHMLCIEHTQLYFDIAQEWSLDSNF